MDVKLKMMMMWCELRFVERVVCHCGVNSLNCVSLWCALCVVVLVWLWRWPLCDTVVMASKSAR